MGLELRRYSGNGGLAIGLFQIIFGLIAFAFQILTFTTYKKGIWILPGIWGGVLYMIIGIVTFLAGLRRTRPLVAASLGLSLLGIIIEIVVVILALLNLPMRGYSTIEFQILDIAYLGIALTSVAMFIFTIAASILACCGLGCCCCKEEYADAEVV